MTYLVVFLLGGALAFLLIRTMSRNGAATRAAENNPSEAELLVSRLAQVIEDRPGLVSPMSDLPAPIEVLKRAIREVTLTQVARGNPDSGVGVALWQLYGSLGSFVSESSPAFRTQALLGSFGPEIENSPEALREFAAKLAEIGLPPEAVGDAYSHLEVERQLRNEYGDWFKATVSAIAQQSKVSTPAAE